LAATGAEVDIRNPDRSEAQWFRFFEEGFRDVVEMSVIGGIHAGSASFK
jgi:hypothetical protein